MQSEFDLIERIRSKYNLGHIGDDCAVLPKDSETDLLITADMLIQNIDFRLDWTTPELLGWKSLAVSLSDIAAMGGTPKWAMLSIGVPEDLWKTGFLDSFYKGWHDLASNYGVELVGGDISRSPSSLVIDSIVGGEVYKQKAILRSGAVPGDAIFVTGFLGGAAAGLKLLESGQRLSDAPPTPLKHLMVRQLQPIPQIKSGNLLQECGLSTAMIDISDGLSSDLSHLINASKVGARIYSELIPIDPAISSIGQDDTAAAEAALNGGEDFELLFTTNAANVPVALDLGFHQIGEITSNTGCVELIAAGKATKLESRGYRHF